MKFKNLICLVAVLALSFAMTCVSAAPQAIDHGYTSAASSAPADVGVAQSVAVDVAITERQRQPSPASILSALPTSHDLSLSVSITSDQRRVSAYVLPAWRYLT